jgi:hypothetical protein
VDYLSLHSLNTHRVATQFNVTAAAPQLQMQRDSTIANDWVQRVV